MSEAGVGVIGENIARAALRAVVLDAVSASHLKQALPAAAKALHGLVGMIPRAVLSDDPSKPSSAATEFFVWKAVSGGHWLVDRVELLAATEEAAVTVSEVLSSFFRPLFEGVSDEGRDTGAGPPVPD